jgi:hypothetical protein
MKTLLEKGLERSFEIGPNKARPQHARPCFVMPLLLAACTLSKTTSSSLPLHTCLPDRDLSACLRTSACVQVIAGIMKRIDKVWLQRQHILLPPLHCCSAAVLLLLPSAVCHQQIGRLLSHCTNPHVLI